MTLEEQLAVLAELGLTMNDGVTIDDLLCSFEREEYESDPFELLLFVFGGEVEREPWERAVCDRVWNFDTECVTGDGSYVEIVERLCRVAGKPAGKPGALTDVEDAVDFEGGESSLEYTLGGERRRWTVEVNDDWVDMMVVSYVMEELEDGGRFYYLDNGQAMVLMFLDDAGAERLQAECDGLQPVVAA
jgi:hypothetical protein